MQPDAREFMVAFLPAERRVLTRTGVEIHRLQYWDDALATWVGQRTSVQVHYDPRDITYVYVRTPAGTLAKATVTTPGIFAISLAEWSARRQGERASCRDPSLIEMSGESLRRGDALVSQAKASRQVRRRHATAAAGDRFGDTSSPSPAVASEIIDEIPVFDEATQHPFAIEEPEYEF